MGILDTVVESLWLFLPAYVANMTPVFAAKVFPRWDAKMDRGRMHRDGRPVLGPNKTWRGLISGIVVGAAVAGVQAISRWSDALTDFGLADGGWAAPITIGAAMGLGTGLGDAGKSYFKRRTGRTGGAPWVPFDQLDFVAGGLLFAFIASQLLSLSGVTGENWWQLELLGPNWPRLLVLVLFTPILHFLVNIIGYKLKLKKVPW